MSHKELTMNRLILIASAAFLLASTTGCLHHNTRGGCKSGNCGNMCSTGNCGKGSGGLLGKLGSGGCSTCGIGAGRNGCVPSPLGWQQGGHNYSGNLGPGHGQPGQGQPGHGGYLAPGHRAAQQIQSQPFNPGPPTGTVAYPYYTHRGPRDFLLDNPPTIGR